MQVGRWTDAGEGTREYGHWQLPGEHTVSTDPFYTYTRTVSGPRAVQHGGCKPARVIERDMACRPARQISTRRIEVRTPGKVAHRWWHPYTPASSTLRAVSLDESATPLLQWNRTQAGFCSWTTHKSRPPHGGQTPILGLQKRAGNGLGVCHFAAVSCPFRVVGVTKASFAMHGYFAGGARNAAIGITRNQHQTGKKSHM